MSTHTDVSGVAQTLVLGDIPELQGLSVPLRTGDTVRCQPHVVGDFDTFQEQLDERAWDVVLVEAQPDGADPVDVVRWVKQRLPQCPVVMVARPQQLGQVLEATRARLDDYVVRGPQQEVFRGLLAQALRRFFARRKTSQRRQGEQHGSRTINHDYEEEFWAFFDAAPTAMDILDLDGTIVRANPALEEFLGYSSDELEGRPFTDLTHDEESQEARDLVEALVTGRASGYEQVTERAQRHFVVDRRYCRKDGSVQWANLVRLLICDVDGSPSFVVGMLVDITERKQAEDALRESEARKKAIVDTAVDAIISIDEQGIILSFNQVAEEMFGYLKDEVVGHNVKMLMPSPHRERHDHYLQRYLDTGEAHIIGIGREVKGKRKDGSTFPLELGVGEARIDGRRLFTGILRDLSEKKDMERQLRQAEKMKAVGQLAGGIAHDFNNVLSIVNSYAYVLQQDLEEGSDLVSFIEKIKGAVKRGERLISQLLAFSPEQVGEPEILDLNDVITKMQGFVGQLIEEDIAVELDLAADLAPVEVDPGQMEQLLMNLVVNARDAMPSGGVLTLRTCNDEISEAGYPQSLPAGRYAVIEVEDTGAGMDEETQARLFDPFFTTKLKDKGTGLGLATVYGIVHRYDGYIGVDSEPGEGSFFSIYLPVADGEALAEQSAEPLGRRRGRVADETILLVEDEEDIREPLRHILQASGYTVLESSTGDGAVELGRRFAEPIDLLLTDVVLPGLSGVQAAGRLNEVHPEMKIIFISGYTGDVLERKNLGPGRVLIQKPFNIDELLHTVRKVLETE